MLLSQLSEDPLNLLTLVSSMPSLRYVLEVGFRQVIVSIMTKKAPKGDSITKLNSRQIEIHQM
jgi:hypothetical protein